MPLLALQNVAKHFDGVTAVDDVSFTVDRGEVVGFLGPNGAGKSTTMRMITQFLEPDAGGIALDGTPLGADARASKRRIGYLPESNPLYGDMLVSDYLAFIADLREIAGADRSRALDEAVASTGLEPVFYRPIGELSKGYRQRTGLAQAILHKPDLLVLDEPTEGLDPNQRVEIRHLIAALGRDRTVLLIINQGRIVADGGVDALLQRAEGAVQISVEAGGAGVAEKLGALPGVTRVEASGSPEGRTRVTLSTTADHDLRPDVFALATRERWTLYELHQEQGSLESLFRQLTASPAAGSDA
jgi:ABC-2 type transport system ATP-binding protein